MCAYRLSINGETVLEVDVERPDWMTGPVHLPEGWLRGAINRALRRYFQRKSASVFTV